VESRRALGSRYELVERLGGGAMGEVWRTWDRTAQVWVAAKMLRPELTREPAIVTRFVQERAILLGLEDPHIVRVRDLVVEGEDLAIVMDLVEGPDLGTLLRTRGTLTAREAVEVTCAVLDALVTAHAQQCLHRDVKPDNVLLPSADDLALARLSDFGIARLAQESTVQATGLLGTPGYMPPELFVHGTFSAASDVYATGVLLYELLAGRTPFSGSGTAHTVGYRHVNVAPPRLDVAPALWRLLATMLAKDPSLRLSAAGTASALRELSDADLSGPALPVQPTPDTWEDAPTSQVAAGPVRVQVQPADLDVGATNLHAVAPVEQARATGGRVEALLPVEAPAGEETRLGLPTPSHVAPRLERAVQEEPPEERKRRAWPWVVGVLVALCLVTGLLWFTGVIGGRGDDDGGSGGAVGAEEIAASGAGTEHASGLQIATEATYEPEQSAIALRLTLERGGTPLDGELLQVVPGLAEEPCPNVSWDGVSAVRVQPLVDGIDAPCGWRLRPGLLERRAGIEATVHLDLGDAEDPQRVLQAWLDSVEESTRVALESIERGYDFPAQRLEGISVEVRTVVRDRAEVPVPFTVYPVWRSGVDRQNPLFRSPLRVPATGALGAVSGGGIEAVEVSACRAVAVDGVDLAADQPAAGCQLRVRVGELESEAVFDITTTGS